LTTIPAIEVGTPGRKLVIRVWIALPKKAALYTMIFPPEQRFRHFPGPDKDPMLRSTQVSIKTAEEQAKLRVSGRLAADILDMIGQHVAPGVSTDQLDALCNEFIVKTQQAVPANVGYRGFPKTVCTSVNHVVCHGIPNDRVLKSGDIVNIDVAIIKDGYHGDTSRMYYVGKPSIQALRLSNTCREAMWKAIDLVRPGAYLGDIGHAIQSHTDAAGFSVVREYCGHGIGRVYHEDPQVLHYGDAGSGMELVPGMVFTIEPMINAGKRHTRVLPDGWTVVTKDHSLSAQWEHMVLVTPAGHEVLTLGAAERGSTGRSAAEPSAAAH
jgi:methionyl aminopeptidase